ncbi:MAG: hypothetical protein ABJK39_14445 [Hyphomicrobiales bacterium]
MKYGYVHVSDLSQKPNRPIAALIAEGCDRKNIFVDKASGKYLKARPEPEKVIDRLGTDDVL